MTEMMFTSGGASAVFTRHPLERLFRDSQVVRQHGFVAASRYETDRAAHARPRTRPTPRFLLRLRSKNGAIASCAGAWGSVGLAL